MSPPPHISPLVTGVTEETPSNFYSVSVQTQLPGTPLPPGQLRELAQELASLARQQSEMLQSAVYIGMSQEEAAEYDRRRARITEIFVLLGRDVQL